MTETRRDVSLSVVIRIERTGNWVDWSTGHRSVPEVLAVAEPLASLPAVAEIRFDRITRTTERLSLHDLAAEDAAPADRTALEQEVKRLRLMVDEYAAGARGLSEKLREERARAEAMTRAMESTAADALKHRGCHRDLMGQCLRAERAEAAVERVRSVLESEAVVGRSALDYRGLITSALVADEAQQPEAQADDEPAVCEGFQWIGQSFATCDRCGQPAWDHAGEEVAVEGAGPFDTRRTVRPWKPGQADAMRAKWAPPAAVSQPGKEA